MWKHTCAVVLVILGVVAYADAAPVATHVGNTDPASEGWTFDDYNGGTGVQSGGVDTEAYWQIHRNPGAAGRYIFGLTTAQVADPSGWTMTARAKAVISVNTDDVAFGVFAGEKRFTVLLFPSGAWTQNSGFGLGNQLSTVDATLAYLSDRV